MQEIGHWINGKRVAGTSGRFADVMNPATGEASSPHAARAVVLVAAKAPRRPRRESLWMSVIVAFLSLRGSSGR